MSVPIWIMFLGLAVVNVIGLWFANYFRLLIFLDTVATAVAGIYFGVIQPWGTLSGVWAGITVGVATNLITGWKYRAYLKFLHVNALCGVVWGLIPMFWVLPPPSGPETTIVLYILGVGAVVGVVSAVAAVPVRIFIVKFQSNHLLDQVSDSIWKNTSHSGPGRFFRILSVEYLLSHYLDKVLSTTLAVIYVLGTLPTTGSVVSLAPRYRNLLELLAAYYFVALAIAVRSLGAKLDPDALISLLGPLGFFAVLMAAPLALRLIT